jgi:hypothetical protein
MYSSTNNGGEMNMKTLTIEQVFQQMADNVRAGKSPVDGLQGSSDGEGWAVIPSGVFLDDILSDDFRFRLIPRTHNLNGYDVPAPETEAPEEVCKYWVIDTGEDDGVDCCQWTFGKLDKNALRNGLWLSKEDATANAKALRGESPYG